VGKFSAAKIFDAMDQKLQKAFNYLIDLLETGYVTEAYINGHKVQVKITPQNAFEVYIDNVKTMGISSDGKAFIQSISNLTNSAYYMTYGYGGSPGIECFMPVIGKWLNISPTIAGDITIYDANSKQRMFIAIDGAFIIKDNDDNIQFHLYPDGGIELVDISGNQVFTAAGGATTTVEMICKTDSGMKLGVDATGPYKVVSGSKTYL